MRIVCQAFVLSICTAALLSGPSRAEDELLQQMLAEDRSAVDALVLYPDSVLVSILDAATHPDGIVKLSEYQSRSREAFRTLTEELPREQQEQIWELVRHSELVSALVEGGKKSSDEIARLAEGYPESIKEAAGKQGRSGYSVLERVHEMTQAAEEAAATLVASYPPHVQDAYASLVTMPEVLSILSENLTLTLLVGARYKEAPNRVLERAAELRMEAARANAEALEDWKRSLEENPEALDEYQKSAQAYAEETGQDTSSPPAESPDVTVNVTVNPYPYWWGYPTWYASPYWYPYPYYYHWGFYYGPSRTVIVIGTPSVHYTHWHFHHHHHHHHYPHLSNHFYRHYERHHRHVGSGFHDVIHDWERESRQTFDRDWLHDDGDRAQRFAEYGRFEEDFAKARSDRPDLDRQTFLNDRQNSYPALASDRLPARDGASRSGGRAAVGPGGERQAKSGATKVRTEDRTGQFERARAAEHHERSWKGAGSKRKGGGGRGARGGRR